MKTAADRLRELRLNKGFENAADAARAFGWNEHTYKSHENGLRGIRPDAARKYASAYGSTPAYILVGNNHNTPVVNQVAVAPLVGNVSAGAFLDDEGFIDGGIEVPTVPRNDIPAAVQYALKVNGPSVNKRIADGMYAICAPYDRYPGGPQHGALVHVIRERHGLREHTIKELRYTADGMILMPVSTDPRFQEPVSLEGDDDTSVRIQGVVIGKYEPL
jgi:SOS-response transcriptional repressor LexA